MYVLYLLASASQKLPIDIGLKDKISIRTKKNR